MHMDHIEMLPYCGYNYKLQLVDHLSKFGYIHPMKTRTSMDVGQALVTLFVNNMTPRILQSDNSVEVSITLLWKLFLYIV
jgi:hypothetical protein